MWTLMAECANGSVLFDKAHFVALMGLKKKIELLR